jgi:hypothetical protein
LNATTSDTATKDGRIYNIDQLGDPTPASP